MRWTLLAAVVLAGCKSSACGLSLKKGKAGKSDPVEFLASYAGPSFSELGDIEVDGDKVWFCSGVIGLNVYDASNPNKMKILDRVSFAAGDAYYPRCQHLALAGKNAYATNRGDSIQPDSFISKIDASNPAHLTEVDSLVSEDNYEGITAVRDLLFVAAHEDGLIALNRHNLEEVGRVTEGLTNPWQVRIDGDLAYVADGDAGLTLVDISDPTAMEARATIATGGTAKDLELWNDVAYVAAGSAGLAVVDLQTNELTGVRDTPGSALAVARSRAMNAVYVSDWNDVRVFDVTDRRAPVLIGHEPVLLHSDQESRTLGIGAGDGDVFFSGNWTELSSYRYHADRASPDLDLSPGQLFLQRTEGGESTRGLLTITNSGGLPLEVTSASVHGKGLEVDLEPFTLNSGLSSTLAVTFAPRRGHPLDGWINLRSNDPDEPNKCVPVTANRDGLGVGDKIPNATFFSLDGEAFNTREMGGKVVLLAYFATF